MTIWSSCMQRFPPGRVGDEGPQPWPSPRTEPTSCRAQLRLRELILSGEFEPGERMSELPLVERLGVSRTPLRLALAELEHEGLLRERSPGAGTRCGSSLRPTSATRSSCAACSRARRRGSRPSAVPTRRDLRRCTRSATRLRSSSTRPTTSRSSATSRSTSASTRGCWRWRAARCSSARSRTSCCSRSPSPSAFVLAACRAAGVAGDPRRRPPPAPGSHRRDRATRGGARRRARSRARAPVPCQPGDRSAPSRGARADARRDAPRALDADGHLVDGPPPPADPTRSRRAPPPGSRSTPGR